MGICPSCATSKKKFSKADIVVALAGNANVGKSTIFNQLTGVGQIIGNWPGKTVERAEGILQYKGYKIKVIDLPGIYSFSTFSMEELISRDFIAKEKPDVVINIVDATTLERNLFFSIQLLELGVPVIIALNRIDLIKKKGINIDIKKLEKSLDVPVIPTAATKGKGLSELIEQIIKTIQNKKIPLPVKYGKEVEERIEKLIFHLNKIKTYYPVRWLAIKLLEKDQDVIKLVGKKDKKVIYYAEKLSKQLEKIHGHSSNVLLSSERYYIADNIAKEVQKVYNKKYSFTEKLDKIVLNPYLGYLIIIAVVVGLLVWTFFVGFWISSLLSNWLGSIEQLEPVVRGSLLKIIWNGAFTGFVAGITLIIPYVLPFYLLLAFIEDSGYLTRIAVMLDRLMHKIGLHGKAIIPMILGYGCSVPACFSCRIMETPKQKLLSAFLVTLIPCTARTVVILGLVAAFVNIYWALALFAFDIFLIILLGRIAFKIIPGESVGLIMEMPDYHMPSLKVIFKQTWVRTRSILWIVFPAYIVGSALVQLAYSLGWLNPINNALSIITVDWLRLPIETGILLIFGIVRKELTILMLAAIFQTINFATILTNVQMIVLSLVTMIYIPCLATILALAKEFGWKKSAVITVVEIMVAIFIGGIASRLLGLFM